MKGLYGYILSGVGIVWSLLGLYRFGDWSYIPASLLLIMSGAVLMVAILKSIGIDSKVRERQEELLNAKLNP